MHIHISSPRSPARCMFRHRSRPRSPPWLLCLTVAEDRCGSEAAAIPDVGVPDSEYDGLSIQSIYLGKIYTARELARGGFHE